MALTTCPDCNSEVSTDATACPKCGRPTQKAVGANAQSQRSAQVILIIFVAVCVFLYFKIRASWDEDKQKREQEKAAAAAADATCYVYWADTFQEGAAATTRPAMFPTEQATLLFQSAISHRDEDKARDILGHAQLVTPGSRAEVLERKPAMRRVRVDGQVGWILDDVCHPRPPR